MTDEPVSLGFLLLAQFVQLVVCLPVGLILLWLLRTRWLIHVPPTVVVSRPLRQSGLAALLTLGALGLTVLPAYSQADFSAQAHGWVAFDYQVIVDQYANAGIMTLMFLVQALFEEVLFRAIGVALLALLLLWLAELVLLEPVQRRFGRCTVDAAPASLQLWRARAWHWSGLLAVTVLSFGFAIAHGRNEGITPVAMATIALAGQWLGLLFWRSVSLLPAWSAHFVWNAALALAGLPVSGFALLKDPLGEWGFDGANPSALSGGAFGPEGAVTAVLAFAALNVWLLHTYVRDLRQLQAAVPNASDSGSAADGRTG
jgi:hypothetical protein